MRWLILLAAPALWGQGFEISADSIRQGGTIRLRGAAEAARARMGARTVPLFAGAGGERLGLMPVPVDHATGRHALEFLGADGSVLHSAAVHVLDGRFRKQNITTAPSMRGLEPWPGEMEAVAALRNTVSEVRHWEEPFAAPAPGCMNSPFGVQRLHDGKPTGSYHRGVDQRGPTGRPVRAVAAGVVRISRMFNVHGGTVGIDHGQGLTSIYIHMSKVGAREGAMAKKGEVIGYIGSTGFSTGPHLHWGLHVNGVPVQPLEWVKLTPCGAAKKARGRR